MRYMTVKKLYNRYQMGKCIKCITTAHPTIYSCYQNIISIQFIGNNNYQLLLFANNEYSTKILCGNSVVYQTGLKSCYHDKKYNGNIYDFIGCNYYGTRIKAIKQLFNGLYQAEIFNSDNVTTDIVHLTGIELLELKKYNEKIINS